MKAIDTRGKLNDELKENIRIEKEKLEKICKNIDNKKTCRYIMYMEPVGFFCAKNTKFKQILDEKVEDGDMFAQGDNCEGL